MEINEYLNKHTVLRIGKTPPEYVCYEVVVDNPKELISVARKNGCYISFIRWWDRVSITTGSTIGYGGPRDPEHPDSHFFAETDICRAFNSFLQDDELYKYIDQTKHDYPNSHLFPAFNILRR